MQRVVERLALVILVCLECLSDVLPLRLLHDVSRFSCKLAGANPVG